MLQILALFEKQQSSETFVYSTFIIYLYVCIVASTFAEKYINTNHVHETLNAKETKHFHSQQRPRWFFNRIDLSYPQLARCDLL